MLTRQDAYSMLVFFLSFRCSFLLLVICFLFAASNVFKLLAAYKPESKQEKKARLLASAGTAAKDQDVKTGKKPVFVKYGLNHVTSLVESRKAKLVIIAHDVDPIEVRLRCMSCCCFFCFPVLC